MPVLNDTEAATHKQIADNEIVEALLLDVL